LTRDLSFVLRKGLRTNSYRKARGGEGPHRKKLIAWKNVLRRVTAKGKEGVAENFKPPTRNNNEREAKKANGVLIHKTKKTPSKGNTARREKKGGTRKGRKPVQGAYVSKPARRVSLGRRGSGRPCVIERRKPKKKKRPKKRQGLGYSRERKSQESTKGEKKVTISGGWKT